MLAYNFAQYALGLAHALSGHITPDARIVIYITSILGGEIDAEEAALLRSSGCWRIVARFGADSQSIAQ